MNALALARLDDPLVGSKHALRRSGFPCTLASGLTSLQPANDVGETSPSYDEHASGSLFWTQKDPTRFDGQQPNLYVYAGDDPINGGDPTGKDARGACILTCVFGYVLCPGPDWLCSGTLAACLKFCDANFPPNPNLGPETGPCDVGTGPNDPGIGPANSG